MAEATTTLAGKTMIVSGGSRGIGLAIALRAAADGANITLIAKTDTPNPKLPGTIHTAAAELEQAGGKVLPFVGDIRDDDAVHRAVERTVEQFGGIDIVVNNASAIDLSPTEYVSMKRYDLMCDVNCRGSFLLSKLCIPALRESAAAGRSPHILTLSPPLNLDPKWAGNYLAYTIAKYGMSLTTLGLAYGLKDDGIAVNSLWPRTSIATAAVQNLGGELAAAMSRTPEIMADAAYAIITAPSDKASGTGAEPAERTTGNFHIDENVLAAHGVTDFDRYRAGDAGTDLQTDIFLD